MKEVRLILYDGYCKLCSGTVRWVRRNDRKGRFRFKPLQDQSLSEQASPERASSEQASAVGTVVLVENGRRYERSTAAIRIAMGLRFPWPLLGILFIVPRFARDGVYDMIARNRKRWFGEHATCYLPED